MLRLHIPLLLSMLYITTAQADCDVCPTDSPYLVPLSNPPAYSANGCGPASVSGLVPDFDFKSCCDQHDFCYSFCNSTKSQCDNNLHNCMKTICTAKGDKDDSFCDDIANLYFDALNNKLSCSIYKKSILESCQCQAMNPSATTSTATSISSPAPTSSAVTVSSPTKSDQSSPTIQPNHSSPFGANTALNIGSFVVLLCIGWVL